MNTEQVTKLNQ